MNIDEIKEQFKSVITYSQKIEDPQIDELFERWHIAKQSFINIFGGELIYTYPEKVTFELDDKEKNNRLNEFIDSLDLTWNNSDLASFVDEMRDNFYSNLTPIDYIAPSGKVIKKGTKLIKAFKHFIKNPQVLEAIQNEASRIIQENKVEGYLHLSVHPLDFLSLSENSCNWRSCHALDGDYRSGNLTYMVDDSTFIYYLSNDKNEKIPNFPFEWNSKKWRVLMFFSNDWDMMFAGRQYPFFSQAGLNILTKTIMPKLHEGFEYPSDWHDEIITSIMFENGERAKVNGFSKGYVPIGKELISLKELINDNMGSMHFNDLLNSSCYSPMYVYFSFDFIDPTGMTTSTTRFYLGGEVKCLKCGLHPINEAHSMVCSSCWKDDDTSYTCDCCGRHVPYEDTVLLVDGERVCENCVKNHTKRCGACGHHAYGEDMVFIEEENKWYCYECFIHRERS